MTDILHVERSLQALHPAMLPLANELANLMAKDTILRVYETFRTPARQAHVLATAASHAKPWSSAHQYGLAMDFAGFRNGGWSWKVEDRCWDVLHERARKIGLLAPIPWDLGHIQHPLFSKLKSIGLT